MKKARVLFMCVHNSARSLMAEAFLNKIAGDKFHAESAGLEPGKINPYVIELMFEVGVDLTGKRTNDVFEFFREGRKYDYVITVCDESNAEKCPIFPGKTIRFHWNFEDPSSFKGTHDEIMKKTRMLRDRIKERIELFIKETRS